METPEKDKLVALLDQMYGEDNYMFQWESEDTGFDLQLYVRNQHD